MRSLIILYQALLIRVIKSRMVWRAGHVARMGQMRSTWRREKAVLWNGHVVFERNESRPGRAEQACKDLRLVCFGRMEETVTKRIYNYETSLVAPKFECKGAEEQRRGGRVCTAHLFHINTMLSLPPSKTRFHTTGKLLICRLELSAFLLRIRAASV
jgi:hypothetical protein